MSESLTAYMWRKATGKKAPPDEPVPKDKTATPATPASAPKADFSGLTNPKRVIERRLAEAEKGMKCGGQVKRMKSGGSVRGTGCATKGHGKGKMR